jgi:hypothetical protein
MGNYGALYYSLSFASVRNAGEDDAGEPVHAK